MSEKIYNSEQKSNDNSSKDNSLINKDIVEFVIIENSKKIISESKIVNESSTDSRIMKNNIEENPNSLEDNKNIFSVINNKKEVSLFTKSENDLPKIYLKNKRSSERKKRRDNQDNIRKKLKRRFLNTALIKRLNKILVSNGSKLYFDKFPQSFVSDIVIQTNQKILNKTLEDIFESKELYNPNELEKYYHNLKVIKSEEIQKNEELKEILNKKYRVLFEEYINSKEFKIDEINRLRENNMEEDHIERYIYLAQNFIEFFSVNNDIN